MNTAIKMSWTNHCDHYHFQPWCTCEHACMYVGNLIHKSPLYYNIEVLCSNCNIIISSLQPYLSLSFFTSFGCSYLHKTENMSPPSLVASHRFLITATLRHSQVNFASRFVWRARPIPSRTIRSTPSDDIAFAKSRFKRLKAQKFIQEVQWIPQFTFGLSNPYMRRHKKRVKSMIMRKPPETSTKNLEEGCQLLSSLQFSHF